MITYQDLLAVGDSDNERMAFVYRVIQAHKSSDIYDTAVIADEYARQENRTIMWYQKMLYTMTGEAVPDNYSANYKLASNFFYKFITQQNQYLLGNGVSWSKPDTADKLGKDFDSKLQEAGYEALVAGESFGFWNLDHLEVFNLREFAPLYDEENGALKAGVRFWQIDSSKPLRATLYELDGYTEYIWNRREVKDDRGNVEYQMAGAILNPKRSYILKTRTTAADGTEIYDGENYPSFPIVPLWGNQHKQSELIGLRSQIDAYDLIKSGFANDLDDASQIYWTIQNAGGMDDVDLAKFIERMKTVKASVIDDDGARAESHTMDVPYASREALLSRLRADMYEDFMALDTREIAGGAVTATQIQAEYEPLNNKTDMYEFKVIDFIQGILYVAGIDDDPTFTRSIIVNRSEQLAMLLQSAQFLSQDYVTGKILELFGDGDKIEDVKAQQEEEAIANMPLGYEEGVTDGLRARENGSDAENAGEENI